jgi:hypothetical protein
MVNLTLTILTKGYDIVINYIYNCKMNVSNIVIGICYGLIGQILTFFQLQVSHKLGWYDKYKFWLLLASIPISWVFMESVKYFIKAFNGEIWPSRIIGFALGMIVFTVMSYSLFKEPFTLKTMLSLLLAFLIIVVQIFF